MIIPAAILLFLAVFAALIMAGACIACRKPKSRREKLDALDAEIDRQQSRAAKADQRKRSEIYAGLLERMK